MVVKRGTNDHEIVPMARHFRGTPIVLRFIEYMDVGATNGWRMDEVLPSAQVIERLQRGSSRCEPIDANYAGRNGAALALRRRRRRDRRDLERDAGVLPRLQPRAAVDRGQAVPVPVRERGPRPARAAARARRRATATTQIAAAIGLIWQRRDDRYSELRSAHAGTDASRRAARRDALHRRLMMRCARRHHRPHPRRRTRQPHGRRRQGAADLSRHAARRCMRCCGSRRRSAT